MLKFANQNDNISVKMPFFYYNKQDQNNMREYGSGVHFGPITRRVSITDNMATNMTKRLLKKYYPELANNQKAINELKPKLSYYLSSRVLKDLLSDEVFSNNLYKAYREAKRRKKRKRIGAVLGAALGYGGAMLAGNKLFKQSKKINTIAKILGITAGGLGGYFGLNKYYQNKPLVKLSPEEKTKLKQLLINSSVNNIKKTLNLSKQELDFIMQNYNIN